MTPAEFKAIAVRLYGAKRWRTGSAKALGLDRATVFRISKRPHDVPGPCAIAMHALLEQRKQSDELEKKARTLLREQKRIERLRRKK